MNVKAGLHKVDVIVCLNNFDNHLKQSINLLKQQTIIGLIICVVPFNFLYVNELKALGVTVATEDRKSCLAFARRLGVNFCSSEWIAYVDSNVFLHKKHLEQLLEIALTLPQKNVAIEGVLQNFVLKNSLTYLEGTYSFAFLKKGDRGYTHNTLLRKKTLLSWKPVFTYAFEDYLLTQHVLSLGGVWMRTPLLNQSFHLRSYSLKKRACWASAGERLVKKVTMKERFSKSFWLLYRGLKLTVFKKDVRFFVHYTVKAFYETKGYLKWNKYIKQ